MRLDHLLCPLVIDGALPTTQRQFVVRRVVDGPDGRDGRGSDHEPEREEIRGHAEQRLRLDWSRGAKKERTAAMLNCGIDETGLFAHLHQLCG